MHWKGEYTCQRVQDLHARQSLRPLGELADASICVPVAMEWCDEEDASEDD